MLVEMKYFLVHVAHEPTFGADPSQSFMMDALDSVDELQVAFFYIFFGMAESLDLLLVFLLALLFKFKILGVKDGVVGVEGF